MAGRGASRGVWGTGDDYTFVSLAVIVVGVGFGGWLLWQEQHAVLSSIAMAIMHGEMWLIHFFTNRFDVADAQVLAANPARVTFSQLVSLSREIGRFLLYPATAFVLFWAWACVARAAPARFRRSLDVERLMRELAKGFKSTAPYIGRRLRLEPIGEGSVGVTDPALNPGEWIQRYATDRDGIFDEALARAELVRQLGPTWSGISSAPASCRVMLAAIALYHGQRRKEAHAFLGEASVALSGRHKESRTPADASLGIPAGLAAKADALLRDSNLSRPVLSIMGRHHFVVTGLMSALVDARLRAGSLAPVQFGFLKLADRGLWYALHSLGFAADGPGETVHPAPRIEAIGVRDHWAAECAVGGPLAMPSIDRALAAVRAAARDENVRVR
jgi:intracellular multiplication protein IcmP